MKHVIPSFLILLFCLPAFANKVCRFPQTLKRYDVSAKSGITHGKMKWAMAKIKSVYGPIAEQNGATLVFNDLWDDPTVNSDTYRQDGVWYIDAYGGLARFPGMTPNAMLEVFCHETGHQLGGHPTYNHDTDWAAVEGQADYWATKACMKKMGIDSTKPSQTLADTLAELDGEPMPKASTPDKTVQTETEEDHPPAQCRLDTYIAGKKNACRPHCWFAGKCEE